MGRGLVRTAPSPSLSWRAARCTQQAPGATTPLRHPLLITARMGHRAGGVGPTLGRRSSRSKRLAAPSGTAQASGRIGTGALSSCPSLGSPPARPRGRPEPPGPTQPARLRERAGCAGAKPGSRPPRLPASHPPAPRPCHPGTPLSLDSVGFVPRSGASRVQTSALALPALRAEAGDDLSAPLLPHL